MSKYSLTLFVIYDYISLKEAVFRALLMMALDRISVTLYELLNLSWLRSEIFSHLYKTTIIKCCADKSTIKPIKDNMCLFFMISNIVKLSEVYY